MVLCYFTVVLESTFAGPVGWSLWTAEWVLLKGCFEAFVALGVLAGVVRVLKLG